MKKEKGESDFSLGRRLEKSLLNCNQQIEELVLKEGDIRPAEMMEWLKPFHKIEAEREEIEHHLRLESIDEEETKRSTLSHQVFTLFQELLKVEISGHSYLLMPFSNSRVLRTHDLVTKELRTLEVEVTFPPYMSVCYVKDSLYGAGGYMQGELDFFSELTGMVKLRASRAFRWQNGNFLWFTLIRGTSCLHWVATQSVNM